MLTWCYRYKRCFTSENKKPHYFNLGFYICFDESRPQKKSIIKNKLWRDIKETFQPHLFSNCPMVSEMNNFQIFFYFGFYVKSFSYDSHLAFLVKFKKNRQQNKNNNYWKGYKKSFPSSHVVFENILFTSNLCQKQKIKFVKSIFPFLIL